MAGGVSSGPDAEATCVDVIAINKAHSTKPVIFNRILRSININLAYIDPNTT